MRRVAVWGSGVVLALLGACSSSADSDAPTTITSSQSTTTAAPSTTTTAAPSTTTGPPATTTTDAVDIVAADAVGSADMVADAVAAAVAEAQFVFPDLDPAEVPIPDLTTTNPVDALGELFAFDRWVTENHPNTAWVPVIALDDSQAGGLYRRFWDSLYSSIRARWAGMSEGYTLDAEQVSLDDLPIAPGAELPDGAVAIRFSASSDGYDLTSLDSGEILERVDLWQSSGVVIVVPTEAGWRMWLAESDT